jgi:hypothetical protein
VLVPRAVTEEQRRLLEEFEARSDESTYRGEGSLFDRIKSAFR